MKQKYKLEKHSSAIVKAEPTIKTTIKEKEEVQWVPTYKMDRKWTELADSYLPDELYYSNDHVWIKLEAYGTVKVGLTDLGQKIAGPISLIHLRKKGKKLRQGENFGMFYGARVWVGPIRTPVSGKIIEVNKVVSDDPEAVNIDPYGKGWLIRMDASKLEEEVKTLHYGEKKVAEMIKRTIEERKRKPSFFW